MRDIQLVQAYALHQISVLHAAAFIFINNLKFLPRFILFAITSVVFVCLFVWILQDNGAMCANGIDGIAECIISRFITKTPYDSNEWMNETMNEWTRTFSGSGWQFNALLLLIQKHPLQNHGAYAVPWGSFYANIGNASTARRCRVIEASCHFDFIWWIYF